MSILEDIGSVAETPSPSTSLQPRSRLRTSSRISRRFQDRMRDEEDETHADTDESSPQDMRASRRRSQRSRPTRLTMRGSSEEEIGDDDDEEEEIDGDDDPNDTANQEGATQEEDDDGDEEEEEGQDREEQSRSRYSFRERGSVKKPARFDQSMYDEVFQPMRQFANSQTSRNARRRESQDREEKSSRRGSSHRSSSNRSKRRRLDDDDDDDVGDEVDELDYATDESDIVMIQRRIEEQERAEAAEAAAALAAVEALEHPPLHTRSTRYALRQREGKDSLSPVRTSDNKRNVERNGASSRRRARRTQDKRYSKSEPRDKDEDEDEDEDDEDQQDQDLAGNDGRRYYLRQRSHSDLQDQEDELVSAQSRRSSRDRAKTDARDRERDRRRRAREQSSTIERDQAIAAAFAADESAPRYSLRDRSKVQRLESTPAKDHSMTAYSDFAKRQAGRTSQRGVSHSAIPSSATERRSSKRSRKRRGDRRRRLSSSSSSGSSDDLFKYYDSDQGGMRTGGGKRRGSGSGDHKRADISPIEVDRSITWDSVGGLEKHIEALKEMVMLPLLYPEFYDKYNVTPPSGVLFYGPPGTGKTLLARALANSCTIEDDSPATNVSLDASEVIGTKKPRNVTFYMRKGADCLSKWVGEAERQLRLLFEEAKRNQPSIIFFDEIDGLAPVRSAKQDQIHASIVSTLLALMDGMDARGRVVVIGATNRLDAIDPALRRPGRFDRELGFKLPNVVERKRMLEIHTKKWNPPLSETFVQEVAQRTVGYCGADVKALCAEAALCSLRRVYPQVYASQDKLLIQLDKIVVSRGDFTKAMRKITPASHRTVSSFASPLPKSVKALLDASLRAILRKIASQFPLFPLEPQAVDVLYKSDGAASGIPSASNDGDDDDENEDDDIYAVMNHDDCDVCHGDEGELMCCDACPGAFHANCLPVDHARPNEKSIDWFCPECKDSDKMEALLEAKQKKLLQRQARQMYMLPQLVGFPRVLITGKSGMGQEYIAAALLHAMEGLTHFSLDYPSLVADVNTHSAEEALIHRLNEAQKCLPCVVFLPQIDLWWENTPESMHVALKMMLMNMQVKANLPVLFLATTSSASLDDLSSSVVDLFAHDRTVQRSSITWQLTGVTEETRRAHFHQAFAAIGASPLPKKRRRGEEKLEILPLAPVVKKARREPTLAELERIREHDLHCLRELRIFLGQVLDYCQGQRNYSPFHHPVDQEAVPDYYLIIKNPMDLSTMRERLNDGDYTCFEQFLDDIQLIVRNANMFNPKRSATRHIAQTAGVMKDNILSFAHRFRKHQGYDLFAKCREITKRLHINPALYSEVPDITTSRRKLSSPIPVKPPSRVSDRLRGIQAPEAKEEEESSVNDRDDRKLKSTDLKEKSTEPIGGDPRVDGEDTSAPQWFGLSDEPSASTTSDRESVAATDDITSPIDSAGANDTTENQIFDEGDAVFVLPRTFPGMNKLGGVGKVVRRNEDGSYFVKYVLGGSEKNIEAMFVRTLTDEAVKESVKNRRNNSNTASLGKVLSSAQKEPLKTNTEIQTEFFDNLVWPILHDDGWKREEMMDVSDDGTTTIVMRFEPPSVGESSTEIALEGVDQVLEYINKDRTLAVKCFGKRFAEELPTEAVFGENSMECAVASNEKSEEAGEKGSPTVPEGRQPSESEEIAASYLVTTAMESEASVEAAIDEEADESCEFVYDAVRMARALDDLVRKTGGWTVGELRDELLLLNKLAYPFRYDYDRSKLMQDVEARVALLSR